MQLSKQGVDEHIEQEMLDNFLQIIADIRTPQEAHLFLSGLLTDVELITFIKRIAIVQRLNQGDSYDAIRDLLKVSSATIATMQSRSNHEGILLALKKIEADKWAEKWTKRILDLLGFRNSTGALNP